MNKKILCAVTAVSMALTMTACSGKDGSSDENNGNTLSIMGKKSDLAKSYMTSIFEQYEKSSGVKLKIISVEDADYEDEAAKRIKEGTLPDVFLHFNNSDLNRFDVEKNFCYLNDEKWVSELTDSAKEYCLDSSGDLLGLPFWESSVSGCYYNKTILNDLGLDTATTQAEFDMLCQALDDIGYTPICWPADGCSWMLQFGLDPIFADDPSTLEKINKNEITYADIPEVKDMTKWIYDAAKNGWFGSDYKNTGWDDISPALSSGNAVMTFIWDTWFYTDFKPDKYTVDDFALMPVFMDTADNGTYEGGNLNMMMVNKNSQKADKAKEFLAFCADADNYNIAFDGISTVSCFKNQTTNIQSQMVTDEKNSIDEYERVSTASTRIIGYSADETAKIFNKMFVGDISVDECINLMDENRINAAHSQGIKGF